MHKPQNQRASRIIAIRLLIYIFHIFLVKNTLFWKYHLIKNDLHKILHKKGHFQVFCKPQLKEVMRLQISVSLQAWHLKHPVILYVFSNYLRVVGQCRECREFPKILLNSIFQGNCEEQFWGTLDHFLGNGGVLLPNSAKHFPQWQFFYLRKGLKATKTK